MSLYFVRPLLDQLQLPLLTRFQNLSLQFRPNEKVNAEVVDVLPSGAAILRIRGNEVEVKTQIPLQKGMQLELQVLPPKEQKDQVQFQLLSFATKRQQDLQRLLESKPKERMLLQLASIDPKQIKEHILAQKPYVMATKILEGSGIKRADLLETVRLKELASQLQPLMQDKKMRPLIAQLQHDLSKLHSQTKEALKLIRQTFEASQLQKSVTSPQSSPLLQQLQVLPKPQQQAIESLVAALAEYAPKSADAVQLLAKAQDVAYFPFALSIEGDLAAQVEALVKESGLFLQKQLHEVVKKSEAILQKLHPDPKIAKEQLEQLLKEPHKAPEDIGEEIEQLAEATKRLKSQLQSSTFSPLYDYTRLMSFLSGAVFVPFFWELGEGALELREPKKGGYLCKIYLELEEVGSVEVDLFLHDRDLLVDFWVEDADFAAWLQEGMQTLRESLHFREVFVRFHHKKVDQRRFVAKALQERMVDIKT